MEIALMATTGGHGTLRRCRHAGTRRLFRLSLRPFVPLTYQIVSLTLNEEPAKPLAAMHKRGLHALQP
jgi:hypothetical protein